MGWGLTAVCELISDAGKSHYIRPNLLGIRLEMVSLHGCKKQVCGWMNTFATNMFFLRPFKI